MTYPIQNNVELPELVAKTNGTNHSTFNDISENIEDLNRQSKRMQELIDQVELLQDPQSKELVQECISEILSFYGNGIERILDVIGKDANASSTKIYNDLIEDSFVSGLLLIHDLHPLDLQTRLNLALEKVRPYIHSHGGSVEILSLEDGVATIKLSGSCKSCSSSSVTLELAIKQAIDEHCPDLVRLDVEGIEPKTTTLNHFAPPASAPAPGWKAISGMDNLTNGKMKFTESNGVPLVICKVNDQLYAYRNNCPACDLPLSTGAIEENIISCRLGHKYDLREAGKCENDAEIHLDPFPLLSENGIIKVAVA